MYKIWQVWRKGHTHEIITSICTINLQKLSPILFIYY